MEKAKATVKAATKANPKAGARQAKQPGEPEKVAQDPVLHAAYLQGYTARRSAISRDDAPHGDGHELKAWQQGYDAADKAM